MLKFRLNEEKAAVPSCPHRTEVRPSPQRFSEPVYTASSVSGVTVTPQVKQKTTNPILFGMAWTRPRKRALFVLAAAALFGLRWNFANQPPAIPLPAIKPSSLTAPNAGHFYAAGADALDLKKYSSFYPDQLSVEEKRKIVADTAESLTLIREGFAYRYQGIASNWFLDTQETADVNSPAPNYTALRTVGRLFVADAQVAAAEGRVADAMDSSLDAVRFGQDVSHGNTLIDGMIGTLCQSIGITEALRHVKELTAAEARVAATHVAALISEEPSFTDMMQQERMFIYATMQKMFSSSSESAIKTALATQGMEMPSFAFATAYDGAILWYGKDGLFQSYRQYMDDVQERTQMPYQQAKILGEPTPSIGLLRDYVPSYSKAFSLWTRVATQKRILLAQLAVQAYRQENGGMAPESLYELTAGETPYLSDIPTDLFSQSGADPLCYKDGVVYSVGENGFDDGNTTDDTAVVAP